MCNYSIFHVDIDKILSIVSTVRITICYEFVLGQLTIHESFIMWFNELFISMYIYMKNTLYNR